MPYAAIVRYFTAVDGAKGEVLVVSRITATEACHVAYIDALATPEAIVLARRVADERRGRSTAATSRGGKAWCGRRR